MLQERLFSTRRSAATGRVRCQYRDHITARTQLLLSGGVLAHTAPACARRAPPPPPRRPPEGHAAPQNTSTTSVVISSAMVHATVLEVEPLLARNGAQQATRAAQLLNDHAMASGSCETGSFEELLCTSILASTVLTTR